MWGCSYYNLTIRYDSLVRMDPPAQPAKPIALEARHVEPSLPELDLVRVVPLTTRQHEQMVRHIDCILDQQVVVLDIAGVQYVVLGHTRDRIALVDELEVHDEL